jgi:chromate transporter
VPDNEAAGNEPKKGGDTRRDRLGEVAAVMAKLGVIAFGGPAVHVAMLREETVQRRHWLGDEEFLDLFGAVSVLPGPSSTQLAIALSRRRAGWWGLVVGGVCFIGPAMLIVLGLAWAYVHYRSTPTGGGLLYGIEPVVVAVVAVALWELGRTALRRRWYVLLGAGALAAYYAGINVLAVLAAAGLIAAVVAKPGRFHLIVLAVPAAVTPAVTHHRPGLSSVAAEFAKLGVVVFGGGYVLLAFLRRDLVDSLHWLSLRQVLDAVAAGQVTPGPVFTTATFLGYLIGGVPAALVATAGIFLPSFAMVTALEPVVRRIRRSEWATAALGGITVAALGLMAGVTGDLGRAAISDPLTAALAITALAVLLRWRPNAFWLVAAGAIVGITHALI